MVIVHREPICKHYIVYSRFSIAFVLACMRWSTVIAMPILVILSAPIELPGSVALVKPNISSVSNLTIFEFGVEKNAIYTSKLLDVDNDKIVDELAVELATPRSNGNDQVSIAVIADKVPHNISVQLPQAMGVNVHAQYNLRTGYDAWVTDLVSYRRSDRTSLTVRVVAFMEFQPPSVATQRTLNAIYYISILIVSHIVVGSLYGVLCIQRIVKAKVV
jgi:hypothetical protein